MNVKQVIVVRTKFPDGKGGFCGIRRGKEIAQAAHASMMFLTKVLNISIVDINGLTSHTVSLDEPAKRWIQGNFAKVCLQVEGEQELLAIHEKAIEAGLRSHTVQDAGLTEFKGIPTLTCLAIGPDFADRIDPITGGLRLY